MTQRKKPVGTAYDRVSSLTYDRNRFTTKQGLLFDALEWKELKRAIVKIPKGGSVLEAGCGTARFSQRLGEFGYNVRAVDLSPDMLEVASEKCKALDNVTFALEEAVDLSSEDSTFDLTFSIRVTNQTESVDYALEMIQEMIRVTKLGGLVLVEFVNAQRPFSKKSKDIKLSGEQISEIARESNCRVERQRGILIFSQTILNKVPRVLIPLWHIVEQLASAVLGKWASRGYIILEKLHPSPERFLGKKIGIFVVAGFCQPEYLNAISGHVQIPLMAAKALVEGGYQVTLITTKPRPADILPKAIPESIQIKVLVHASRNWPEKGIQPIKAFRQFWQLLSFLKRESFGWEFDWLKLIH